MNNFFLYLFSIGCFFILGVGKLAGALCISVDRFAWNLRPVNNFTVMQRYSRFCSSAGVRIFHGGRSGVIYGGGCCVLVEIF